MAKGKKRSQREDSTGGVLCRVCGREVVLNPNGTIKVHNAQGLKGVVPCPGAGLKVAPPRSSADRSSVPDVVGREDEAKKQALPTGPKTWKCPNCLKRIDVVSGVALVQHQNLNGQRCRGSGYQIPEKSSDALDYRVAGSFEGGRGRR